MMAVLYSQSRVRFHERFKCVLGVSWSQLDIYGILREIYNKEICQDLSK